MTFFYCYNRNKSQILIKNNVMNQLTTMEVLIMNRDSKVNAQGHIEDRNESKKKKGNKANGPKQKG